MGTALTGRARQMWRGGAAWRAGAGLTACLLGLALACVEDSEGFCGDGIVGLGEVCDRGPDNDDSDRCTSECHAAVCGDGLVWEGVEACDDGNTWDSDGCSRDCANEGCGNGRIEAGELCDDGNKEDGDGCSAECEIEEDSSTG